MFLNFIIIIKIEQNSNMRSYALIALLAATVYADGHLPTNSTMVDEHHDDHHEDHKEDDMNTAEQLIKAIDDITELFMEEADLIHEGKINPKALEGAKDFREMLEMICEVDHDEDHHDGHEDDHHEDKDHDEGTDHNRMLDGHDSHSLCDILPDDPSCKKDDNGICDVIPDDPSCKEHKAPEHHEGEHHVGEHHEDMDMVEERDARCMKAWRLLRTMEEYANEDTTDERRDEITEMWSEGLDSAWSEMFEGASTIAASVAGLATAVTVLSF